MTRHRALGWHGQAREGHVGRATGGDGHGTVLRDGTEHQGGIVRSRAACTGVEAAMQQDRRVWCESAWPHLVSLGRKA